MQQDRFPGPSTTAKKVIGSELGHASVLASCRGCMCLQLGLIQQLPDTGPMQMCRPAALPRRHEHSLRSVRRSRQPYRQQGKRAKQEDAHDAPGTLVSVCDLSGLMPTAAIRLLVAFSSSGSLFWAPGMPGEG